MALASANDEVNLAGGIGIANQLYGRDAHVPPVALRIMSERTALIVLRSRLGTSGLSQSLDGQGIADHGE